MYMYKIQRYHGFRRSYINPNPRAKSYQVNLNFPLAGIKTTSFLNRSRISVRAGKDIQVNQNKRKNDGRRRAQEIGIGVRRKNKEGVRKENKKSRNRQFVNEIDAVPKSSCQEIFLSSSSSRSPTPNGSGPEEEKREPGIVKWNE